MKAPVTVVTTFGLGRTPAQVGMLAELAARKVTPDFVVGTSLGAINAAALAAGRTPDEMAEFWLWLQEEVFASPIRAIARGITARQARRQEELVRTRIAEMLPPDFADLPIPLRVVATELTTGNEVVLDSGDLPTAVMASCALPGLFPPVEIGGGHFIDGGLVAGMPLRAVPDDTRTLIVLDTGHSATSPDTVAGYRWWEVGALSYAHQIRGQAVNVLVKSAAKMPVVVVSTSEGRLLDFSDAQTAIDAGRQAAGEQLSGLPARLKRGVYNLPEGLDASDVLRQLAVYPPNR
ncbi:MAG: patatin-like phospholipase family protein [Candidatus Nanopelagicales bacterium]